MSYGRIIGITIVPEKLKQYVKRLGYSAGLNPSGQIIICSNNPEKPRIYTVNGNSCNVLTEDGTLVSIPVGSFFETTRRSR